MIKAEVKSIGGRLVVVTWAKSKSSLVWHLIAIDDLPHADGVQGQEVSTFL